MRAYRIDWSEGTYTVSPLLAGFVHIDAPGQGVTSSEAGRSGGIERFRRSGLTEAPPPLLTVYSGMRTHRFHVSSRWTGNLGSGTSGYSGYSRNHEISGAGKAATIPGSSDPAYRGDASRYNPEELLIGSLSTCHMLWMLHLCADAGIIVTEYSDEASGEMAIHPDGAGEFAGVTLRPRMTITDAVRVNDALALHDRAHHLCFIARSVNFPVKCEPVVTAADRTITAAE